MVSSGEAFSGEAKRSVTVWMLSKSACVSQEESHCTSVYMFCLVVASPGLRNFTLRLSIDLENVIIPEHSLALTRLSTEHGHLKRRH